MAGNRNRSEAMARPAALDTVIFGADASQPGGKLMSVPESSVRPAVGAVVIVGEVRPRRHTCRAAVGPVSEPQLACRGICAETQSPGSAIPVIGAHKGRADDA